MKKFVCVVSLPTATLFCVSVCMADSDIPNLVGTWTVKSEGGLLLKGKEPGPKTNYTDAFGTLNAEAVITKQQGRIIHGSFKLSKGLLRILLLRLAWIIRPYIMRMKMVFLTAK